MSQGIYVFTDGGQQCTPSLVHSLGGRTWHLLINQSNDQQPTMINGKRDKNPNRNSQLINDSSQYSLIHIYIYIVLGETKTRSSVKDNNSMYDRLNCMIAFPLGSIFGMVKSRYKSHSIFEGSILVTLPMVWW